MRFLLFISIWVLGFAQSLQAQNIQNTRPTMEQFVLERVEEAIPNETQQIKITRANEHLEGNTIVLSTEELQERLRRSYWELQYIDLYNDVLKEERKKRGKNGGVNRSNGTVNNPDLSINCAINIVVIIDRSASINGTEPNDIRTGLNNFVGNMVGTGNTVRFIGMGSNGGGAAVSPSVTYSPGNPATHTAFINSLTFSGGNDSWSSALNAASGSNPDLVLIISDGDGGHGSGETAANCAAANTLKNGGAHLFVFGQGNPTVNDWMSGSLVGAVSNVVDPSPVSANNPPTMPSISTTDFIDFGNNFGQLSNWLSVINPGIGDVEITNIWPRTCILNNFTIDGTYDVCNPLTATSLVLRFFNTNGQSVNVPVTLNNDGTWTFTSTLTAMVNLGLSHGTWYDVEPILTLSDGTVITGLEIIAGTNNDLFLADQSDPIVIVNDDPNDFNTSMTTFCVGSPIFYHGTDPLSFNHFSAIRRMGPNDANWTDYMAVGWLDISLNGFNGNLNAQYPGYFTPGDKYQLTIATHHPERCIAWTTTTVEFEVISSQVNTTNISPRTCIKNDFSINGEFSTCAPLTATDVQLEFWQNGAIVGGPVPATVNQNGTWTFSSTLQTMLGLGLQRGNWYDVVPVLTLSDGSMVTGDDFIAGQNNDFYLAAQSDPIVIINDDPNDFTTSMYTFCVGSPIFYHGTDPTSSNHFSAIRRMGPNDANWTDYMAVEWVTSSLHNYTGDLNAQYPGYFTAGDKYQLTIATHNPAECIVWTPITVEFEVVTGQVNTTSIWPRTCITNSFAINGNFDACAPLTATGVQLEFWQNGAFTGVAVDATINPDGTWNFSSTRGAMVGLGLEYGNWYDVIPVLTLSDGTTVNGEEFVTGQNNDLYFADQSDPIVVVNDDPNDFTTARTRFCAGDPIFYHGTDPQSSNHYTSIRTWNPITNDWTNYMSVQWVGSSLNGFTGNLNQMFPGYFTVDNRYQLTIATHSPAECIGWTPVQVEFEVIDCCTPDWELTDVPECVNQGEEITVTLTINAPLDLDDIESIYSSYNNYTYVSHVLIDHGDRVELFITFLNRKCSCEGERLVFDIILSDCETPPIWVMTDPIPCCLYECDFTKITDWRAGEECILLDGYPARNFCIEVVSEIPILNVFEGSNEATCQVDLHNLQITAGANNTYTICGVMRFTNPNCTYHATVSLLLETERSCCEISQGFSFPRGCTIDEACQKITPDIELVQVSKATTVTISLGLPIGETVTVIDHNANTSQTVSVQSVLCNPLILDGTIVGGSACNGINIFGTAGIDCRSKGDALNGYPYFLEIQWGKCTWILTGDYCEEIVVYTTRRTDEKGGEKRTDEVEDSFLDSKNGQIKVFPNPIAATDVLNFDLSDAGQTVNNILITNTYGSLVESIVPAEGQHIFQHRLQQRLANGIYLVVFQMADGTVKSTKLVAIE